MPVGLSSCVLAATSIREILIWVIALAQIVAVWCTISPSHFISTITFHRMKPPRVALLALRVAAILILIGGLFEFADYLRGQH